MQSKVRYFKLRACALFLVSILLSSLLQAQFNQWELVYYSPVVDIDIQPESPIYMVYAVSGNEGGIEYFSQDGNGFYPNTLIVSVAGDSDSNRIFFAFGDGTDSDGLYSLDIISSETELIAYGFHPHFVKRLPSGLYFGYGNDVEGGLLHSVDGNEWTSMDYFDSMTVFDIVETGEGVLFVGTNEGLFLVDGDIIHSQPTAYWATETYFPDLHVRCYPYDNEVFFTYGEGSYSDGVYRIEYEEGEITDYTLINWIYRANKLSEFGDYLVVGRSGFDINLFLVEPIANGQGEVLPIATEIEFNNVYCFGFNPLINTPNITVGTDTGLYQGTATVFAMNEQMPLIGKRSNLTIYPNPFNPSTTVSYTLSNPGFVEITLSNLKGQKITTLVSEQQSKGVHKAIWDGKDDRKIDIVSGVYLCSLLVNGRIEAASRCLLLK
jgi:hypothetical protein